MNVLNKFTIRNLRLNKKRTIVTIIGIILSCALICGVAALVTSFQNALIEDAKNTYGNYHVMFYNVPQDEQKYLENNINVKESMKIKEVGYAKLVNSQNLYKPYLFLQSFDDKALKNLPVKLIKGRMPKNSNEIVISEHIIYDGNVKLNVGDKLKLNIGKRMIDGYELNQSNSYTSTDNGDDEDEELVEQFSNEYTIVGVIARPNFENYSAPGYTIISHLDSNDGEANVLLSFKNVRDTYKITEEITGVSNGYDRYDGKYLYKLNSNLLLYSGVSRNNSVNTTIYLLSGIIILIIVVTSVVVIRNSFSISITERFRQYGMLISVGATSKQIKKNVLFEGLILGIISIPIGIISGIFAIYILLNVVNGIIGEFYDIDLVLVVSPYTIIVSVLISTITIFLSSYLPARKASKISPLEAIRSSNDIKIKGKKLRTLKIFNKMFGIEGEIALKNLKRSRKKYRTTILSIALSIIVFISLNTFIEYGFAIEDMYYGGIDYNITVADYSDNEIEDTMEYYENILKLGNVEKYSIRKHFISFVDIGKYASETTKKLYGFWIDEEGNAKSASDLNIDLMAIGDENYKEYLKKLGLNEKEYENKGILLNRGIAIKDSKRIVYDYLNIKENDKLEFYENNVIGEDKFEIVVGKITEEFPFTLNQNALNSSPIIIVSDKYMENLDYTNATLFIDSSDSTKLENDIKKMDGYIKNSVHNLEASAKEANGIKLVISIFLYGFITVISLIGITNIFNTITTNMALRYKEFAILKSIGMTDKDFERMINFESIFYGLKSLLYGIPIGCVLSYLIFRTIMVSIEMEYRLPYNAILLSIVFVVLIVWTTMRYSLKKSEKLNIIDTIRNENI